MTNGKQTQTDSEICTMRIIFPVESDQQALDVKTKIQQALVDIPDVQIDFRLISGRAFIAPPQNDTH